MVEKMENELSKIVNNQIKDYMLEALECYKVGSYRACVILSMIGGMHDLYDKLDNLAQSNKYAKNLLKDIDGIKTYESNNQDKTKEVEKKVTEREIINRCKSDVKIITSEEAKNLNLYMDLRNRCAHPGEFKCSDKEAYFVFSGIIETLASKKALKGAAYIDALIEELSLNEFFTHKEMISNKAIVKEKLYIFQENAIIPTAERILNEINSDQIDDIKKENCMIFFSIIPDIYEIDINKLFEKKILEGKNLTMILKLIEYNFKIFELLNEENKGRIIAYIDKCMDDKTFKEKSNMIIYNIIKVYDGNTKLYKKSIEIIFKYHLTGVKKEEHILWDNKFNELIKGNKDKEDYVKETLEKYLDFELNPKKELYNHIFCVECIQKTLENLILFYSHRDENIINKYGKIITSSIKSYQLDMYDTMNSIIEFFSKINCDIKDKFDYDTCKRITEIIVQTNNNTVKKINVLQDRSNKGIDGIFLKYCKYLLEDNIETEKILNKYTNTENESWMKIMNNIDRNLTLKKIAEKIIDGEWKFDLDTIKNLSISLTGDKSAEDLIEQLDKLCL